MKTEKIKVTLLVSVLFLFMSSMLILNYFLS